MLAWEWVLQFSQREDVYGNSLQRWLLAIAIALIVGLLLRLIKRLLAGRITPFAERTTLAWPALVIGLLDRTRAWFLLLMALYAGSLVLKLPPNIVAIVRSVAIIALLLQAALWGNELLSFAVVHITRRRLSADAASATTIAFLGFLGKLA